MWVNNKRRNKKSPGAYMKDHVPKDFFMVYKGHRTGQFNSWADCKSATSGYSGAKFKGFYVGEEKEAEYFLRTGETMGPLTKWYSVDVRPFKGSGIYISWNQAEIVVRNVPAQHKAHNSFEDAELFLLNQGFVASEINLIKPVRSHEHDNFASQKSEPFDVGFERLALIKDRSPESRQYREMVTRARGRGMQNTYRGPSILAEDLTQKETNALVHNQDLLDFKAFCGEIYQQPCDTIGERAVVLQDAVVKILDLLDGHRTCRGAQNVGEPRCGPMSSLSSDMRCEIGNAFICPHPWRKIRSCRNYSNSWVTPPRFAKGRLFTSQPILQLPYNRKLLPRMLLPRTLLRHMLLRLMLPRPLLHM